MTLRASSADTTALAFVSEAAELMPKAEASGDRLVTALYLILRCHSAVTETDADRRPYLTCAECGPGPGALRRPYPCRTAQQAFWALDAVLP